jgi:CRISPR-associated protein Csh2
MSKLPNSEILLIYEAKNCNPNGDPDEENRPRVDPKTRINLVSDVRLKRFFRDYIATRFGEKYVFVTKVFGRSVRADQRVALFSYEELTPDEMDRKLEDSKKRDKKEIESLADEVPKRCIDARLFGAVVPIGAEEGRGAQRTFIGPVQFTWGFSLHPVEIVESSTITSVFSGREAIEQYGTMGKDWRLYYSLISFYGVVSGNRAPQTGLDYKDLMVLDNILWRALTVEATTRSKIGERPLLYLRIEYKDSETLLGDLRRFIDVSIKEPIREFTDVSPKFDKLVNVLSERKDLISKIYINCSEEMEFLKDELSKELGENYIYTLPHPLSDSEIREIIARIIS